MFISMRPSFVYSLFLLSFVNSKCYPSILIRPSSLVSSFCWLLLSSFCSTVLVYYLFFCQHKNTHFLFESYSIHSNFNHYYNQTWRSTTIIYDVINYYLMLGTIIYDIYTIFIDLLGYHPPSPQKNKIIKCICHFLC